MTAAFKSYNQEADKRLEEISSDIKGDLSSKRCMILCGWRKVWTLNKARFKKRIEEACMYYLPGSKILLVNLLEVDVMKDIMEACNFKQIGEGRWEVADEIEINHFHGDATSPEVMESIVMNNTINTAIVLGTQATDIDLPPRSRDTRVLSIMLLLRKCHMVKNENEAMHIVGENQEDMTAQLALSPARDNAENNQHADDENDAIPDFINTQAIYARALALCTAFPKLLPVINEIFDKSSTTNIEIVLAAAYVPTNCKLKWGVCKLMVSKKKGESSILVGRIDREGVTFINPKHAEEIIYTKNDKFIVFRKVHQINPSFSL